MVMIGRILIAVGFLIGSLAASLDPESVNWPVFIIALVGGLTGIALSRLGGKKEATAEHKLTADIGVIAASLKTLNEHADWLESKREELDVYEVHELIDQRFPEVINDFVDARESIIHAFSINDYAEIMNHFAAGERSVNRAWSASVDGYIDEVRAVLPKAAGHFRDAVQLFQKLQAAQA